VAYDLRFSAKPSPTGGFRLPAGKHKGILTEIQTKVNKKIGHRFWDFLDAEILSIRIENFP